MTVLFWIRSLEMPGAGARLLSTWIPDPLSDTVFPTIFTPREWFTLMASPAALTVFPLIVPRASKAKTATEN